eukprot:scaffold764_cov248-Pinguiococcus_pyrenoidosus.AAC.28
MVVEPRPRPRQEEAKGVKRTHVLFVQHLFCCKALNFLKASRVLLDDSLHLALSPSRRLLRFLRRSTCLELRLKSRHGGLEGDLQRSTRFWPRPSLRAGQFVQCGTAKRCALSDGELSVQNQVAQPVGGALADKHAAAQRARLGCSSPRLAFPEEDLEQVGRSDVAGRQQIGSPLNRRTVFSCGLHAFRRGLVRRTGFSKLRAEELHRSQVRATRFTTFLAESENGREQLKQSSTDGCKTICRQRQLPGHQDHLLCISWKQKSGHRPVLREGTELRIPPEVAPAVPDL